MESRAGFERRWKSDPLVRGGIGAVATDGFYVGRTLAQEFDALIFFDRSTPSVLLR